MSYAYLANIKVVSLEDLDICKETFSCGVAALDTYLYRYASQDVARRLAKCFVLIDEKNLKIIGYYTLSALSIPISDIPKDRVKKGIPYPIIPAALLGRLAIDAHYKNQGYGKFLIADAIHKIKTGDLGSAILVVDAKGDSAVSFYERLGFIKFNGLTDNPQKLFYPLINYIN